MATIDSREALLAWLQPKQLGSSAALGHRAAVRVLAEAVSLALAHDPERNLILTGALFRACIVSRIVGKFATREVAHARSAASAAMTLETAARSINILHSPENAIGAMLFATDAAARSEFAPLTANICGSNAIDAANRSYYLSKWSFVESDCKLLDAGVMPFALFDVALWPDSIGNNVQSELSGMVHRLHSLGQDFDLWIDWYRRRLDGDPSGFGLPPAGEEKLSRRLIEATDEWWKREPALVNGDIKAWIRELTPPTDSAFSIIIDPEPQSDQAPKFGADENGRIAIITHAGADQLRTDDQAIARHASARRFASELVEALRGHNNAGHLSAIADEYVTALGESVEQASPSDVILHGERMRQEHAAHQAADPKDDFQKLPRNGERAALAAIAAHNMYVGLDPFLDAMDRSVPGPDAQLAVVAPAEMHAVAAQLQKDDAVAEPTRRYMVEAADLAPASPDPENRNSRNLNGLGQNLVRYGIELVAAYPAEAAWVALASGVGATVTLGVVPVGGAIIGAWGFARFFVANESTWRRWAGPSPASQANITALIAFLNSLPIKSLRDN